MNTKHTPGEWYWTDAYPKSSDGERTWSLIGAGGYGILSCDGVGNSPQGLNNEANARLIAAAPELLEALKLVIRTCGFQLGESPTFDVAHAAIQKATGASHVQDA